MSSFGATQIQSFVDLGLGFAAQFTGRPYAIHRPIDGMSPLANVVGTVAVLFDTDPILKCQRPAVFGKPLYYAALDRETVLPGDYLVGDLGTLFITAFEDFKPPLCARCNHTLTFKQPGDTSQGVQPGLGGYEGRTDATDTTLLSGWPASVLLKTRGDMPQEKLATDTRLAYYEVLLPTLPISIAAGMRVTDETGQPYLIASAEQTWLGWRLLASIENT